MPGPQLCPSFCGSSPQFGQMMRIMAFRFQEFGRFRSKAIRCKGLGVCKLFAGVFGEVWCF